MCGSLFSTPDVETVTAMPTGEDSGSKTANMETERRRLAARQGRNSTVLASGTSQSAPQTSNVLVTGGKKKLGA